ncbi:DUF177 domain-containing protein [Tsukamurella asaccharolytica]|uniref:DUF177 domain-containing protein n=1 Tax=Tsukamurella asaccharolytica TaxID=2592067 RepID=A0A5C5R9E4_9ACTN|nr:YceD family protein [Tsukamurella asaccharolytica]TWS18695.1 DUF177 domain-containing protein [Tsukamurella asaccharolytica]
MNEPHAAVRQPAGKPYVLDVRAFGRRPGTSAQVHRTVAAPERIGVDLIGIENGEEVDLDLQVQAVSEGVLVTGTVSADTAGQCARCLDPLSGALNVFLTELYAYPDSETAATTDDDEMYRIEDDMIDLEQAIIDAVGMELALDPTCSVDCKGLCQGCGEKVADLPADHHHEQIDPRWAGLAKFAAEGEADGK